MRQKLPGKVQGHLTPPLFPYELKVLVTKCWVAIQPDTKETVFGLWRTKREALKQSKNVRMAKVSVEILSP